jgi:hypothetical protein
VPQGGLRLGTYGFAQRKLHPFFDSPILQNAIAAICGDVASSVVKVPREVVTQRLQTGMYRSTAEAVGRILREEGFRGLFTGFWSTTSRDVPFMVVLFVSYEQFKQWKVRHRPPPPFFLAFWLAGLLACWLAGLLAWARWFFFLLFLFGLEALLALFAAFSSSAHEPLFSL